MEKNMSAKKLPSLENILNVLSEGVSVLDSEGRFLFINKYALDHNGRSSKDFIGHTIEELNQKGFFKNPIAPEVYKTHQPAIGVQQSVSSSGKRHNYLVHAFPIFDSSGELAYVVAERISVPEIQEQSAYVQQNQRPMQESIEHSKKETVSMIYKSSIMQQLVDHALRIADFQSSILILGESGTGKDVMAQFIHQHSTTYHRSFVAINCASMPESLLESELFGYEKGAFTGAKTTGKIGLIEAADHGTLFLDEINSMPLSIQSKLLRVLESRTITRIGSVKPVPVDFRLIAATNESLEKCVEERRFREDLYYRLNVIPLTIPPLRERRQDIRPLIDHFLKSYCEKYGFDKQLSAKLYKQLEMREWPGNIRELRNYIERLVILTDSATVKIKDVQWDHLLSETENRPSADQTVPDKDIPEIDRIRHALMVNQNHRQKTADYLGISRRNLQYKIKKYNL